MLPVARRNVVFLMLHAHIVIRLGHVSMVQFMLIKLHVKYVQCVHYRQCPVTDDGERNLAGLTRHVVYVTYTVR